eukprot:TRINITY_DN8190_c0_g3_i2.p1 TRINITY_DN8190_c0_g3~~TRINITY_DN8190_c0_g3_i2.p1  ORF type:complete len:533 (-),score=45.91 TRINITY_DN8190_c0_g3_i2:127-1689(-)
MEGYSRGELARLCAGGALVLAHVTISLRANVDSRKIADAISWLRGFFVSCMCKSSAVDEHDVPINAEVSRLMRERQKKRMMTCWSIMCHATVFGFVSSLYNIWNQFPRWCTPEQDIFALVGLALTLVLNLVMNRAGCEATALTYYSMAMGFFTVFIVLGDFSRRASAEVLLYEGVLAVIVRMVATINVLHLRAAIFWNAVISVSTCSMFILFGPEGPYPNNNFVFFEAAQFLFVILSSEGIRAANFAEVYHEVKALAGSIEKSAVVTLLDNMCDATLLLDSSLAISEDALRFKGMLMLKPNSSVNGLNLDSYIPLDDDKHRLHQLLKSCDPSSTDAAVRCFNVGMRDSDGNNIKVEMFAVAFETLNKSINYMLGIRELFESSQIGRRVRSTGVNENGVRAADIAYAANDSHSSDASTLPSHAFSRARQLGNRMETSEYAKIATTINLIGSWNFSSPLRSCCSMHAGLKEVNRMLKRVRGLPCKLNLHTDTVEQCSACGALDCYSSERCCKVCKYAGGVRL